MGLYGADSPKRHSGYSNCYAVGKLDRGKMTRAAMRKLKEKVSTTKVYINRHGRKCWVGTKALKKSQYDSYFRPALC